MTGRIQETWRQARGLALALAAGALVAGCSGPPPATTLDPDARPPAPEEMQAAISETARAAWMRGVYLREQGDVAGALALYGEAVRISPRDPGLRLAYAELLVETGRFRDAAEFTRSAVQRFGGSAEEHLLLARLARLAGEPDRALAGIDSALARDASLVEAWAMRGRLLLETDRVAESLAAWERADALTPESPETLTGLGDAAARAGQFDRARAAFEHALRIDPALVDARRALAGLVRQKEGVEAARALVIAGVQLDPEDPARIEAALETLLENGDPVGAAALLRPYHASGTLDPRLAYTYARLLVQLDDLAAADAALAALEDEEGLRGVRTLRGDIAARQDRMADAEAHYRAAIAADPRDCVPRASLALMAAQRHRAATAGAPSAAAVDSALAAAAAEAGDESFRCNLLLGLAYMARKQFAPAAARLEAAHKLDPDNHQVLFDLAMATSEAGDTHTALAYARTLLRADADDAATLNLVGYLLAERGEELAESEAHIRKALAKEPDNGYYVDSLGWVLYQKGDHKGAVTALERAVRLTKEKDALVLEHLGDAYVKAGRLADARRTYARARTLDPTRGPLTTKIADVEQKLR